MKVLPSPRLSNDRASARPTPEAQSSAAGALRRPKLATALGTRNANILRAYAPLLAAVLLAFTLVGCATAPPLTGRHDLLDFLTDGKTTREDVVLQLGQPSGRFEHEHILTYRLGFEPKNKVYYVVEREAGPAGWPTWVFARYSLVLVFAENGVLQKHSLVEVN